MTFAPHIGPRLFELDDGKRPRAEIWREAGAIMRTEGLLQPSYESVRRIVNLVRELRKLAYSRLKRAVILTAEYLWNLRDTKAIVLDIFDGRDIERDRARYRRRPRTRARASAARSPSGTASPRDAP